MTHAISPQELLAAYANGYFPMARSRDEDELYWFHPEERGIIPLELFHIPRKLARVVAKKPYRLTVNACFSEVIAACAAPRSAERDSWINPRIQVLYTELHKVGHAHSIEAWRGDELVGGLYGVSVGGAFCGESMFSRADDASKIALVALVEIVKDAGYVLLDTQFVNAHLMQFGVQEITREDYVKRLRYALQVSPNPSSRFVASSGRILRTFSSE